jgi:hypothetical protein
VLCMALCECGVARGTFRSLERECSVYTSLLVMVYFDVASLLFCCSEGFHTSLT